MNISEIKRNLGKKVLYDSSEYVLTGCTIRRNIITGQFYYQAELQDVEANSSLIITALDKVEERSFGIESENTC